MSDFASPFRYRENVVNLFICSDSFIFLATICWMEFSQSVFLESGADTLSDAHDISPLFLFVHHCDSRWTYLWISFFNLSATIVVVMLVLCIYAVHQISLDPSCIAFLALTVISFVVISISPIIAFITFFKLSVFVLLSASQPAINLMPAIYSGGILLPPHDHLSWPSSAESDLFARALFLFLRGGEGEYPLRVAVANKILAEHYTKFFWLPLGEKHIAQTLLSTPYAECTTQFVRDLRGCTARKVLSNIKRSLMPWQRCSEQLGRRRVRDKVLDAQYLVLLLVFVPIQSLFALFGLAYPYIVAFQLIADLHAFHGGARLSNRASAPLFEANKLAPSGSAMESLYVLISGDFYFAVFMLSVAGHFAAVSSICWKLWNLRLLFKMCLDVMIVADTAPLDIALVSKMKRVRVAMECTRVCRVELSRVLGRYHLDGVVMEFVGDFLGDE